MKKKTLKIILFSFLFSFLLFSLLSPLGRVFSQGLENIYPESNGFKPETVNVSLPQFVKYIFTFSFIAAGVIAFGSLILAGGRYAFSAGKPEAKKELRKHILSILGGILILLLSYLIFITINPQLTVFYLPELEQIAPVPVGEVKLPEAMEPDPLERIKNVAKAASTLSGQIKQESSNLKNQLGQCDCGSGQSMCLCQGKGGATETAQEETGKTMELEYYSRFLETKTQPFDVPLSSNIDPNSFKDIKWQSLAGSAIYTTEGVSPSIQESFQFSADQAKNVFTQVHQETLNKTPIYFFNDDDYRKVIDSHVENYIESGIFTREQIGDEKQFLSSAAAITTPGGIIIANESRFDKELLKAQGLTPSSAITHEYAHVIDRGSQFGSSEEIFTHREETEIPKLSNSQEYLEIYNRSQYYYSQKVITGGADFESVPVFESVPGFVTKYGSGAPFEDFAETVRGYEQSGGDPAKISSDLKTRAFIQERFDFLKKEGVVK